MRFLFFICLQFFSVSIFAQNYQAKTIDFSQDLRMPMDIDLVLAGNFCEMRSNHFHTGLDIKTQGVEGQKIYSIEDGVISRIRVSPWGYGNAIYVEHTNGLTSVYAHCNHFSSLLDSVTYQVQKAYESYVVDKDVKELNIQVKKGDLIAYSGNSGSSSAPHLHFEIRETISEHAINPLLFDCYRHKITDHQTPEIRGIKLYAVTNSGYLIPNKSLYFSVRKTNKGLEINEGKPIDISSLLVKNAKIAIGVYAIDKLDGAHNVCGIYRTQLMLNNQLIQEQKTEYMDFSVNRFMNSHQDYEAFKYERKHIHKQFSTTVNPLPIYVVNNGIIDSKLINEGQVSLKVFDVHGNLSAIDFQIFLNENSQAQSHFFESRSHYIYPDSVNYLLKEQFQVLFEPASFYEPLEIHYKTQKADSTSAYIGLLHSFAAETTPVQKYYDVRIKVPETLTDNQAKKLTVVCINNNHLSYVGGDYVDGWVEGRVRQFGQYTLMYDTLAPTIIPLDFKNNQLITKYNTLELKITDDLSGVRTYKAYINNKWVLMEYNRRKGRYIIPLNAYSKKYLKKGNNEVKILAIDSKNNQSSISVTVTY